jgi:hypothetical protein
VAAGPPGPAELWGAAGSLAGAPGTGGARDGGGVDGPTGCGNARASCTTVDGCLAYAGETSASLQANCPLSSGTWSTSGCPTAGSVGRCVVVEGSVCLTEWGYKQATVLDEQTSCSRENGTWYAP